MPAETTPLTLLAQQANRRPRADAVQWPDGTRLDYRGLHAQTHALAAHLRAGERPPGTVLTVDGRAVTATLRALYAAPAAGLALFPLDPHLPAGTRTALLAQLSWVGLQSDAPDLTNPLHAPWAGLAPDITRALPATVPWLHLATSGSTGTPKVVRLSGAALAASVAATLSHLPLAAQDRWLACLPLFHIGGLMVALRCAAAGACVVLQEGFHTERAAAALLDEGITHVSLVPAMLERLLDHFAGRRPPHLQLALIGGGPLAPALATRAAQAGWPLCVSYGMTETASQIALDCGPQAGLEEGAVGRPLPGFEITTGTGPQQPAPIRVRGPALMLGYADQPLATDGWHTTGDLGYLDSDGTLHVVGRTDDVLISGGENVHPAAVEALLHTFPGIRDVAVCGRPDPVWGQRLVALIVGDVDEAALQAWGRSHLPSAWRPRELVRVAALPRNALGKLERRALGNLLF